MLNEARSNGKVFLKGLVEVMEPKEVNVRPSVDLRNKYSEISKLCRETREVVIIIVNSRADTVVLGL